jgi:multiple sugar transport system substrate-binding protein
LKRALRIAPLARLVIAGMAGIVAAAALAGCRAADDAGTVRLKFWAMGREGEVVSDLMPEFERRHPGIDVRVQQMPWTAAHEKLLTAFVGDATPDLVQLGNTWIPEFAAIGAIAPLDARVAGSRAVVRGDYFPGIWEANLVDGRLYGIPWYVDTRLLFYRSDLVAAAGYRSIPPTWSGFLGLLDKLQVRQGRTRFSLLLPIDEYNVLANLAMQHGAPMLSPGGRRGAFREPRFRRAFELYVSLYHRGFAPAVSNSQIANVYQQFAAGDFAFFPTGPWNLGEFKSRLPPELDTRWATSAWPAVDAEQAKGPGVAVAGGSSLAVFRASKHPKEAWQLAEYLSESARQVAFYRDTGDLPARFSAWRDPALHADRRTEAFYRQLQAVRPVPPVPEWEQIATKMATAAESAVRGKSSIDEALAWLDHEVDQVLEKRRFLLDRKHKEAA